MKSVCAVNDDKNKYRNGPRPQQRRIHSGRWWWKSKQNATELMDLFKFAKRKEVASGSYTHDTHVHKCKAKKITTLVLLLLQLLFIEIVYF